MQLTTLDWSFVIGFFILSLGIGIYVSRQSGKSTTEYFLSGRNMPWWLLGMSMVATTFSTDTPNLVTDIVRQNGVAGNWVWWAFLLTGMLTVFVYARLWRKSEVLTDMEFYELRYSGFGARFLRGFRAIYLGLFFNVLAMAGVCLAAIKIGAVLLGLGPVETILIASVITVVFSALGGFRGVLYTDFLLFFVAMFGAISAAVVALEHEAVGGLSTLVTHPNVSDKLHFFPDFTQPDIYIPIFLIPLAIQWWNAWYPGAEPGGGGYIAQRMLAAKDQSHAVKATLFFNVLHYALRPWPWILVALASLVVFPDLESLSATFPNVSDEKIGHDVAYSAMLSFLPHGLLGVVVASLVAAFMSTISTHLNWGASYLVHDFYRRFVRPEATEKELVGIGRIATVLLMALAALFALQLQNAKQLFDIIIMFGAGTGLIFLLRWFWWRINAWSEISAMLISGAASLFIEFVYYPENWAGWSKFICVVVVTTITWLSVTFLTPPDSMETLAHFYKKTTPGGAGWKRVTQYISDNESGLNNSNKKTNLPATIFAVLLGSVMVYAALFATGNWLYGQWTAAILMTGLSITCAISVGVLWRKGKLTVL